MLLVTKGKAGVRRRERLRTTRVVEMAEFAGISEQAMRKWLRLPGFPMASDGSVCLWDIVVWHNSRMNEPDESEDPALEGPDSPAMERYRMARAKQEEIKLALKLRQILDREIVHDRLTEIGGLIREAGDLLQRQCGSDAFKILDDTLTDIERKIEEWFSDESMAET